MQLALHSFHPSCWLETVAAGAGASVPELEPRAEFGRNNLGLWRTLPAYLWMALSERTKPPSHLSHHPLRSPHYTS